MQVVSLGCPICGGPIPKESFEEGIFCCPYCNSSLKFKGESMVTDEKPIRQPDSIRRLDPIRERVTFDGVVILKTKETKYKGCPKCYKKEGLCEHIKEPISLYWREYLVSTEEDERTVICGPMQKELGNMELHKFDAFLTLDGTYRVTAIDTQAEMRREIEAKIAKFRELLSDRVWDIKRRK